LYHAKLKVNIFSAAVLLYLQIGSRRYCGTTPPRNFTAPAGSNVTIEFVSDHSDQQKGFIVSWKKKSKIN